LVDTDTDTDTKILEYALHIIDDLTHAEHLKIEKCYGGQFL